jgi:hypothetical protein
LLSSKRGSLELDCWRAFRIPRFGVLSSTFPQRAGTDALNAWAHASVFAVIRRNSQETCVSGLTMVTPMEAERQELGRQLNVRFSVKRRGSRFRATGLSVSFTGQRNLRHQNRAKHLFRSKPAPTTPRAGQSYSLNNYTDLSMSAATRDRWPTGGAIS